SLVPLGPNEDIPEGKTMQFWTKPEGAKGPTSLGLVKPGQVVVVPVSKLPGLADKTLFELTLEPAGGSPYPKPSGPILYVGRAVRV
ncbi:anti-sigma factor domain-containing protein, partial [Jeotgalibacillus marinus]